MYTQRGCINLDTSLYSCWNILNFELLLNFLSNLLPCFLHLIIELHYTRPVFLDASHEQINIVLVIWFVPSCLVVTVPIDTYNCFSCFLGDTYFDVPACRQVSRQSGLGKKWFAQDCGKYSCNSCSFKPFVFTSLSFKLLLFSWIFLLFPLCS